MNKLQLIFNSLCSTVGIIFGFLFGQVSGVFLVLIAFMSIDYVTGVIIAILHKELSSNKGFKGIAKKLFILAFCAIGHMIDVYIFADVAVAENAVIFFYLANEGISIIENATILGLPVPKKIIDVLAQLKNKSNE